MRVKAPLAGPRWRDDHGMITAEAAVALPALVVLVMAAASAVAVATAQLRCVDAAREGARAAARGETPTAVRAYAARVAPRPAAVAVSFVGDRVEVVVTATLHPLGRLAPAVTVRGRAVAAREPGGSDAPVGRR